ncbi:uncharacterized protein [Argopecten irradians]|uniref:uncharacterized protein n=1 Tax=Argopecten irradians TaxID=31199 RepID=UPI003721400F
MNQLFRAQRRLTILTDSPTSKKPFLQHQYRFEIDFLTHYTFALTYFCEQVASRFVPDDGLNNKGDRFAGYQLYLSNITDWKTGVLCYEDTSSNETEVETVITHQCPFVAQYVTIYNYRGNPKRHDWYSDDAYLELCEVQVYGCPRQKYGYGDCNEMCPDGCYQGTCDASSGSCLYCPPGKWGVVCDMDCHSNCNGGCNVNNGSCAGSTEQCIPREELTVVTVLGTIAGLCLITAIVLFVLLLRSRSILRKEREKDAQYEGIDLSGRIAPNIYESATSTISTN